MAKEQRVFGENGASTSYSRSASIIGGTAATNIHALRPTPCTMQLNGFGARAPAPALRRQARAGVTLRPPSSKYTAAADMATDSLPSAPIQARQVPTWHNGGVL